MARFTQVLHAKRDDPIYKEGLTISTPISGRGPTPSTKSSARDTASPTAPASPKKSGSNSRPRPGG